ncbi:glycoside hydrolase family 97 catalytic domain-containing protein [Microbacterium gubbeenense]|uniref:glycoside hydrolase family 97 catalytic domain-containing protein n=1 Tax=Microbacterium gubbeenense TaxID=159896 RepID=UPI003F95471E
MEQPIDRHPSLAPAAQIIRGHRQASISSSDDALALRLVSSGEEVATIALGVTFENIELGSGATVIDSTSRTVEEQYTAAFGKAAGTHRVDHDELTVSLRTAEVDWAVIVRVSDDGFAFRYALPDTAGALGAEATRVHVARDSRAWVLEYSTWYETMREGHDLRDLAPGDYGFPLLVEVAPRSFLLLTESDIDGRHSGAHAEFDGRAFRIVAADSPLTVDAGHRTPWRAVISGELSEVVASNLVDDLAPACAHDAFVPRPGRAAWSWWSSQFSGAYLEVQKRFTDFAAEQGWEHVLVDCGWDAAWVPELVSYASVRGVQVHVWSSWDDLDGEENLKKLGLWRSWGVAGIKVDFMESESQVRYRWYDAIIAETARVGLAVNFHGSVIPRGWARTHPHVISYEGIRGAEYYVFYGHPLTAAHNVIQPFTRNVVGSMDYTPVTFSAPERETSDGHELALSVVYESGITHFADDPDEYRARPLAAQMLAELPASWQETRLLGGHPDTHAVIARRYGDRWFVGGNSAAAAARTVDIDLAALAHGPTDAWIVHDADGALGETIRAGEADVITIELAPRGGFVAILAAAGAPLRRATAQEVVAAPSVGSPLVLLTDASVRINTDAGAVRTPPGWSAARCSGGWELRPDTAPTSGDLVVVTLESAGYDGVPAVSHARIAVPHSIPKDVSLLPFLSAHNAVGPVERGLANGGPDPRDGQPLSVGGETFANGLGVSQDSAVSFVTSGAVRLTGSAAVDDETPDASAVCEILADGITVWREQTTGGAPPTSFDIDVSSTTVVTLRTKPSKAPEAHVDWLALRLDT